jgi:hypothetical protein
MESMVSKQSEAVMVEPTDAILPILQRIQADMADMKRDVADTKREIDNIHVALGQVHVALGEVHVTLGQHGRKLDAIEGYLTYQLGISSRTIADVEALKRDILEIKRRIEVLEHYPNLRPAPWPTLSCLRRRHELGLVRPAAQVIDQAGPA